LQGFPVIQIEAKGKANPSQRRQDKAVSAELIHPDKKATAVDSILTEVRFESKAGTPGQLCAAVRSGTVTEIPTRQTGNRRVIRMGSSRAEVRSEIGPKL